MKNIPSKLMREFSTNQNYMIDIDNILIQYKFYKSNGTSSIGHQ